MNSGSITAPNKNLAFIVIRFDRKELGRVNAMCRIYMPSTLIETQHPNQMALFDNLFHSYHPFVRFNSKDVKAGGIPTHV